MPSHAGPANSGGWAFHRSVTLLHVFLLASAGILFIGGSTLGRLLTTSLQRQALDDKSMSLTQYVDAPSARSSARKISSTSRHISRFS